MTLRTLLAASLSLLLAVPALAAPTKLAQQGRVLDSTGKPLEGTHAMSFWKFVSWRHRIRVRQPMSAKMSVKHVT